MPIPSLTSSLKTRVQSGKAKESKASKSSPNPPPESREERSRVRAATTASIHHTSAVEGSKKQRHLPQPGELKYTSCTGRDDTTRRQAGAAAMLPPPLPASAKSNDTTSSSGPGVSGVPSRLRPRSMYQTSSHGLLPQASVTGTTRRMMEQGVERPSTAHSPNITRSQSLRKPGSSARVAPPASARTHSRTQSVDTAGINNGISVEAMGKRERPRSSVVPPGDLKGAANDVPVDSTEHATLDNGRHATIRRSGSVRTGATAGHASESVSLATRAGGVPEKRPASRVQSANAEQNKSQSRPAFTTLQQHYTPRKVGKAPTSTFLRPPAPDVEAHAIAPEMAAVQAELLQLHLLHESADRTEKQWELNAKRKLHRRFDEVASLHRVMRESELKTQEQQNLQALTEWSASHSSCSFAEHIQILSGPLQELPLLLHPGGRFERLVSGFQHWVTRVEAIWEAREKDSPSAPGSLTSVEALGDSWRADNASLTRKLTSFQRDLARLAKPPPESSIASIVSACSQLVEGVLEELVIMQKIQEDIVKAEQEWVKTSLQIIARDIGKLLDTEEDLVAWRQ
ncbi:uncharacterized protein EI97DRAFT_459663 [Westerdykella ornata]|uniref:Uncharacterized protein n=1 Tax=Westerdykella ornata TaxID=318751 RepID=A0A6A6JFH2_WESOR|nr:uncharacterized protein EI97DRAFT_459663 [Westerdykella ornata]KAF2275025.1 hypothetical protein EI97DRAFT_459663 [Westerdykella ornata]